MMRNIIALGLAISFTQAPAFGQPYTIDWHTIDSGGAMNATAGTYTLSGTIGQSDASANAPLTGGTFALTGGFWSAPQSCSCLGDMNNDGSRNGRDIQKFVNCMLGSEATCDCADANGTGGPTIADIEDFVVELLQANPCAS